MKCIRTMIFLLATMSSLSISAMQIEADPRMIISPMDKSLSAELDILRVTAGFSEDNKLIFEVKTRGERIEGGESDYVLLQIVHEKAYALFIPVSKEKGNKLAIYESAFPPDGLPGFLPSKVFREFTGHTLQTSSHAAHIFRGAEFAVPIGWINFGGDFSFDAYTVKASMEGNTLRIVQVYDHAKKGRSEGKRFSAITLFNKICTPQGLRPGQ